MKADIGIIGALEEEVRQIIDKLEDSSCECVSGILFYTGKLYGKSVAVARCGVGKVFAAMCAEAMIIKYSPSLIINTGVGGALDSRLKTTDIVISDRLCQYDMDTTLLGDAKGMISGINQVYFDSDKAVVDMLLASAKRLGQCAYVGGIASGDRFVADREKKMEIQKEFSAMVCEMEGGAIAHVAFVNDTPFVAVRAISDSADGDAGMDYATFMPIAARSSAALTLDFIKSYQV